MHDEIDVAASMPAHVRLGYEQEQLGKCFRICRQLWVDGFDRRTFRRIVGIATLGGMSERDSESFKHIRAKFKQLRFAYAALDATHRYPRMLDWVTQTMGRLQDGIRNGDRGTVVRNALALRFLLSAVPYRIMRREIDRFRPTTPDAFRDQVLLDISAMEAALARSEITGKAFHQLRKCVSRQVALYDTLKTLYPSRYHESVGRFLGTVNGMMGAVHDDLVAAKLREPLEYHERPFALPAPIRGRLEALVSSYRMEMEASA